MGLVSRKNRPVSLSLDMKQIQIIFTGKVQGVGFRRTSQIYACELSLKGWVRNLPDGNVEMTAEGKTSDLQSLMDKLNGRFEITGIEMKERPANGAFSQFDILP